MGGGREERRCWPGTSRERAAPEAAAAEKGMTERKAFEGCLVG